MGFARFTLDEITGRLRDADGDPPPHPSTDAFELILHEQVAYLADDATRLAAFRLLKRTVGLTPAKILAAPLRLLEVATRAGGAIAAPLRARRLRASAARVLGVHGGALRTLLAGDTRAARRELAKFPMIGEPGAERILVATGTAPHLAMDSNAMRVLLRIGYGDEGKVYSSTYKSVQGALTDQTGVDCGRLDTMTRLLRRHGQTRCRRSRPDCPRCPLRTGCRTGLGTERGDVRPNPWRQ